MNEFSQIKFRWWSLIGFSFFSSGCQCGEVKSLFQRDLQRDSKVMRKHKNFTSLVETENQHVLPSNTEKNSREENKLIIFFSALWVSSILFLFFEIWSSSHFFESLILEVRVTRNNWFQKPVLWDWRFWSSDRAPQFSG
jgi:hypothetical protein